MTTNIGLRDLVHSEMGGGMPVRVPFGQQTCQMIQCLLVGSVSLYTSTCEPSLD